MALAPIVLFTYNRPDHLARTVEALKNNPLAAETDLIIYSDAHSDAKVASGVLAVRKYIKEITGFKKIRIVESEINMGLAGSIINGVTDVVNEYGRVIVLEDDLATSPHFLKYMNDALELYENDDQVASIHGYIYPVKQTLPETFFIVGADCWGWATWKRGWQLFEADGQKLLTGLKAKKLTKEFDFYGSYPYTRMLESQLLGLNDSWAIRWYASAFLAGKLTLYPGRSLVNNIGMDASGRHSGSTSEYNVELASLPVIVSRQAALENKQAKKAIANYFSTLKYNTLFSKIKFFVKKMLCRKK